MVQMVMVQFSHANDIDALWNKLDKDHSSFIEKEELDILLFAWICQELKHKGEPVPRSRKQVKT